jgi:hypothetical protein
MQATWRVYVVSALPACVVAALVAAGTAFVTVRLLVPDQTRSANTVTLEGTAEVRFGEELEVFYKTRFAEPPHLTFPEGLGNCQVVDQKAASFKLRRDPAGDAGKHYPGVKWKAEGQPTP